jgi:TnpA family transposase
VPVEFLTDVQASAYGRFAGLPSRMQLERFSSSTTADLQLVARRRGDHNRLGFAVQLATVRFLGTFLADPGDVPGEVVDYIAAQLDVDAASMSTYTQREKTRLEHRWEIARAGGYRDFVDAEAELAGWVGVAPSSARDPTLKSAVLTQ